MCAARRRFRALRCLGVEVKTVSSIDDGTNEKFAKVIIAEMLISLRRQSLFPLCALFGIAARLAHTESDNVKCGVKVYGGLLKRVSGGEKHQLRRAGSFVFLFHSSLPPITDC